MKTEDLEIMAFRVSEENKTDFLIVFWKEYEYPMCEIVLGIGVFDK